MSDDERQSVLHPITFAEFQRVLNMLGYGMERCDRHKPLIHWRLEKSATNIPHNGPALITTLMPDFSHPKHEDPVYDRDYVMDLLNSTIAGDFDKDGTVLKAILMSEPVH